MKQSNKEEQNADRSSNDQAESLRRLRVMRQGVERTTTSPRRASAPSRVMSFTSGKGGVGKTNIVVNVAIALARAGRSVLILDADLSLANADVLLGIHPKATLADVLNGTKSLEEIILNGPEGISLIPAASGVESICNLSPVQQQALIEAVESLPQHFDYLLIDTPAGIGSDVLYFNSASNEVVCVITAEPTSLTDAYALIKVLSQNYGEREMSVLANNVRDENDGKRAFIRLQSAVERFLHVDLKYLGYVPSDATLCEAVRCQRALLEVFPSSKAALAVSAISKRIDTSFHEFRMKGGMQFFFSRLLEASAER